MAARFAREEHTLRARFAREESAHRARGSSESLKFFGACGGQRGTAGPPRLRPTQGSMRGQLIIAARLGGDPKAILVILLILSYRSSYSAPICVNQEQQHRKQLTQDIL